MEAKILVDDREHDLITTYIRLNLPINVQRLEVGDLSFGQAVVERKQANDFIGSIVDGRLVTQIHNMQKNYAKSCIVVHGTFDSDSKINENAVLGMLASICARTNVNLVFFKHLNLDKELQDVAVFSHKFLLKANEDKEFASPSIIKPKTSLELRFLAQIEGISLVLAQRLLAKFGSLKGILQASKEELQEIEGVGRVLSSKITDLALKIY